MPLSNLRRIARLAALPRYGESTDRCPSYIASEGNSIRGFFRLIAVDKLRHELHAMSTGRIERLTRGPMGMIKGQKDGGFGKIFWQAKAAKESGRHNYLFHLSGNPALDDMPDAFPTRIISAACP